MADGIDLAHVLGAAQAYRAAALDALAGRLAERRIDDEQRAAHGFAWIATSVAALEAVHGWRVANGDANPLDAQVAELAFAETVAQLVGGLPMGQNELARPADLGLSHAARDLAHAARDLIEVDHAPLRAAIAAALADLEETRPRPLYLIVGMLNTKDPAGFFTHFRGLARHVSTVAIPGEPNAMGAGALYDAARAAGLRADPAEDIGDAIDQIGARVMLDDDETPPRILICGSLYLAGQVLRQNG